MATPRPKKSPSKGSLKKTLNHIIRVGDLIWAEFDKFPSWVAIALEAFDPSDPASKTKKSMEVCFIESTRAPSVAEVSLSSIDPFTELSDSSDRMRHYQFFPDWFASYQRALRVYKPLSNDSRIRKADQDVEAGAKQVKAPETSAKSMNTREYCTCKVKLNPNRVNADKLMIECIAAKCAGQWYHLSCVGLASVPEKFWACPECVARVKSEIQQQKGKKPIDSNVDDEDDEDDNIAPTRSPSLLSDTRSTSPPPEKRLRVARPTPPTSRSGTPSSAPLMAAADVDDSSRLVELRREVTAAWPTPVKVTEEERFAFFASPSANESPDLSSSSAADGLAEKCADE